MSGCTCPGVRRALALLALLGSLGGRGCWGSDPGSGELEGQGSRHPRGSWEAALRHKRSWVWNQFFVLEEYTGNEPLYVGKLHSDVDGGDGKVKYVLSGEGAASIFTIDENTGDIHATKRLDREAQAYYTLQAQAVDRVTNQPVEPRSEFVVKVQDINDNEPKFLDGPYMAGVPEMSPLGTMVVQVAATDADDPTYGNSARVIYSIIHGQPYFSVEPRTGIIRTALPNMDRETRDQYVLVIQAKDMVGQMGGLSGTTSVTVTLTDVNDNPPRFTHKNYQNTVLESLPVHSVVARVKAADADVGPNAEMDYRLMDGDYLGLFNISTDEETQEGVIVLLKPLDFETKSSFSLRIEATNRNIDSNFLSVGPFSDLAVVKLTVEDVNEPPVFSTPLLKMVVSEDARMGTSIGRVSAHDPDSTNSGIRYSIDRNTDLERFFNVDALSGVISTAKPLDREANSVHNLTLLAIESRDCDPRTFHNSGRSTLLPPPPSPPPLPPPPPPPHPDNTASILTKRGGFRRREQPVYRLPVLIVDSGSPALSSTNTLALRVCDCDADGVAMSCGAVAYTATGLSTGALLAILGCILTLLIMVLLIVTMRGRRKTPLILEEERDIRENIVRYDDEGGGEEDTEAFDMVALRNLNAMHADLGAALRGGGGGDPKARRDVTPDTPTFFRYPPPQQQASSGGSSRRPAAFKSLPDHVVFREFIWDRLKVADVDPSAPPYDSLQTYAFEGSGSVAESLSSLESLSSDSEHSYDYLSNWGPRFKKLADLYGNGDAAAASSVSVFS
uniref:Cadherin domain-containing protein n=1 Tax=Gadus morhua TaxID=8049 RepID=A0A8C5CBZ0_GADMO